MPNTVQGPSLELQIALVAVLMADAGVIAALGSPPRILQAVSPTATFPYLTIGQGHTVPDLAECIDGSELYLDLHVWSRDSGFTECKTIMATIWKAVEGADIELTENRLVLIERAAERVMIDADGITKHGIFTLRALTEPAE